MSLYLEEMHMIDANGAYRSAAPTPIRAMTGPLARIVLAAALATSLQGCVEMMVGGAVVGTIAATDRRTIGAQTDDTAITVKAEASIPQLIGDAGHVNIASFNRKVLLTGEVRDGATKSAVEREIAGIQGVQGVINELEVAERSNYTSRGNDALLTGKVKASFVDTKELSASAFKVITERGTVYLMGRVTPREGKRAGEVAGGVSGVVRVVKIFDYIGEDELREMDKRS
jgi:osmotically-inducible protein OsmY